MSFPAFLRTRWAALQPLWARMLQRPEKLLSLHSLLWALMATGLALLLYVLVLIPFTPGIRDIRKAKTEQPAQLVAADGKLLAEYRWVNRAWVPLSEIAPPVGQRILFCRLASCFPLKNWVGEFRMFVRPAFQWEWHHLV